MLRGIMHEMNILVTVAVIAGLYISLFLVVEKVFLEDEDWVSNLNWGSFIQF